MEDEWISYKGDRLTAPENVQGYDNLMESNKKLFRKFLENFYKAWEYPEEHIPVKVTFKRDKANGAYLRVDFASGEWFHVKGPYRWY